MKPGRELDALIAEKVMGWKDISFVSGQTSIDGREGFGVGPLRQGMKSAFPNYSTDIAAAWEVVEKLDLFNAHHLCKNTEGKWGVWENGDGDVVFGNSAPHVICLAALATLRVPLTAFK